MERNALLASVLACSFLACSKSNPAADDRTVQQFTGTIVISTQSGWSGQYDRGTLVVLSRGGTVDAIAVVSPMSDRNFRFEARLDGVQTLLGEPALPPTVTAHWSLGPGTYRLAVIPVQDGRPAPSSPETFSVTGRITFP
jgi:hypothetical protein